MESKFTIVGLALVILAILMSVPVGVIQELYAIRQLLMPLSIVLFVVAAFFFYVGHLETKKIEQSKPMYGVTAVFTDYEPCPNCSTPMEEPPLLCEKCGQDFCGKKCLVTHTCFGDFDKHKIKS